MLETAVENDLILREKVSEMFTEPHKYFFLKIIPLTSLMAYHLFILKNLSTEYSVYSKIFSNPQDFIE